MRTCPGLESRCAHVVEWWMDSFVPTLLSDAQGSLTSVWIVPEDRSFSAKVWLGYHVTQFGSPSQDSEVSGVCS